MSATKKYEFYIRQKEDLITAVQEFGIVPLFQNSIPGFSVEEHVSPEAWFSAEEGVWEWKGPVIREAGCAYGKLFEKKAAFVRLDLYTELANLRRDGYDFDARFDDGLASYEERRLYELLADRSPICSKELKQQGNYGKEGNKGFESLILRLQSQGYVIISDFVYSLNRKGIPYGWGLAEYATPEQHFGSAFLDTVYRHSPEASFMYLMSHMRVLLPEVPEKKLERLLRG